MNNFIIEHCETCNKKFETTLYRKSIGKGRFCSQSCFAKSRKGSSNPNWNGGRKVDAVCSVCGKSFQPTRYQVDKGQGKTCSDLCRSIEHSSKVSGAKSVLWRGGITPERQKFNATDEWKRAVFQVWQRDHATCRRCGKKATHKKGEFHVHHIVSFANVSLRAEPTNLVLLCDKCHSFVHSSKNKAREFLPSL